MRDSLSRLVVVGDDIDSLGVRKLLDQFFLDMRAHQRDRNIPPLDQRQPVRWTLGDEYLI